MRWKKGQDGIYDSGAKKRSKASGSQVVPVDSRHKGCGSAGRLSEERLQRQVCKYLDLQYPGIIYTFDASGLKLPIGLAVKAKSMRCKQYLIPDLIILYPSKGYHGLIIELKVSHEVLYRKDGTMRTNEHLNGQWDSISLLADLNYRASFACGFDEAKSIIDNYFKS